MKKETLKIFVNLIKEEDLNKLKAKFIEIDIDHDGVISINDLLKMLRSLGYNDTEAEIKTLIKKVHLSTSNSN
jgi:Ca2+-binding EF-hand superfamily protein